MVVTGFMLQQEASVMRDDLFTLIRAFRAFDPDGKGYIDADQLKMIMTSRGENFTEDEANSMLLYAADENGRIYYVSTGAHVGEGLHGAVQWCSAVLAPWHAALVLRILLMVMVLCGQAVLHTPTPA